MSWFHRPQLLCVGGAGFIGKHLADRITESYRTDLDLKFGQDVRDGIDGVWDSIVFLAVDQAHSNRAYRYNEELYQALDSYLLEYPQTHVIYTSSAAVYPDVHTPLSERHPVDPPTLYGLSKLAGEAHVQQYPRHTILRLANVHGWGGQGVYDRFLRGETTIYGDGSQVRDFVPVAQVVDAIARAVSRPKRWQGITNVSTGKGTSLLDLFKQFNPTTEPLFVPRRRGDVDCSILDNRKFQRLIGD